MNTKKNQYKTLEDCVGKTPLVRVQRLNPNPSNVMLLKLEGNNPASSVKDRPALSMLQDAEKKGIIKPGDTLIEATSGNTGIALACIAAIKGYKMIILMPADATQERVDTMRAYGAEVILTAKEGSMELARDTADEMVLQGKGIQLDQFSNPANPKAHYENTAKEIYKQTKGTITHFIATMGTTGTITGSSKYFKQKNANIHTIGVHPAEGAKVPGIRKWPASHTPKIFNQTNIDEIIEVTEKDAKQAMKNLAKTEGVFAGPSSGGAFHIALELSKRVNNATIVSIVCDRGDRYLSSGVYND